MKTDQQSHFLPHKRYPHATRKEKEEYNKQTANTKDSNQTVSVTRIFKVNCTCQSHLSIAAFIYTPSTLLKNSPFLYRLDLAPFYTLHYFLLFDPFQTGLFFFYCCPVRSGVGRPDGSWAGCIGGSHKIAQNNVLTFPT